MNHGNRTIDVLEGRARWGADCADVLAWLAGLPDDSVDLLFTSPPYLMARTYGAGLGKPLDEWVAWMVEVVRAAAPKVKGLIAINCEGQTKNYRYLPAPFLLAADLHRAGFNLRKPAVFHRVGICGGGGRRQQHEEDGGGPDWLRNDWEPIIFVSRPGKLPWADGAACGHVPKWAPGGEMSNRLANGARVNQWGHSIDSGATVVDDGGVVRSKGKRPSHVVAGTGEGARLGPQRAAKRTKAEKLALGAKSHTKRDAGPQEDGDAMREQAYLPPAVANPGNVIKCNVGGGQMGHPVSHSNEAPFPLDLPAFFIKSFCPPDVGIVADCFLGSGTTIDAAVQNGRKGIGCDVRQSQIDNVRRRMSTVTPGMFAT